MFSPSNFSFTSSTLTQTAGFVYNYDRGGNLSVSTALHDSGLSPKKWDLSRLAWGRVEFLSTDPLAGQFAGLTPYVFAGGSPIKNIDYLGLAPLDIIYLDADNNELYRVAADGAHTYKQLVNDVDLSTPGMGRAEDRLQWADIDSPVSVTFRAGLNEDVVSQQTRNTLQDIGLRSRVWNIDITSTARNAEQQATAMYNNAVRDVDEQLRTYRAPGQAVIRVFQAAQERELGRAATIQLMTEEINRQGPGNVSRHAADPDVLNVIDISQRTMPNNLHDAFRTEAGEETGVRVLDENNVFHLEVEQDQPDGN